MNRRIVGLETEYGVVVVPTAHPHADAEPGKDPTLPTVDEAVTLMFAATPNANRTTNHFLRNGSRLYVDIGSHPEYAGAECDNLRDVVANDLAGDLLLADLAQTANASLTGRGVQARLHVLRNNVDSVGNTFGCHENYQVPRDVDFDKLTAAMTAFLVTRPVLTGCGHVVIDRDGRGQFAFSTRAEHIGSTTSADPTKSRPLINTKDEPHADPGLWRRLHVLSGDSSVCETTTALKIGWTCLVLDLLETGADLTGLVPLDPLAAMRGFNTDLSSTMRVPTRDGRRLRAVDIQEEFLTRVLARPATEGSPARGTEAAWVLDLVQEGLDALRSGRHEVVQTRLDWAIKRRLLTEYADGRGLDLADPRVARLAFAYHDVDPRSGLAPALRAGGHMQSFVTQDEVQAARQTPPQTTRARVRGDFVAWADARGYQASVDWSSVRLNVPVGPQVDLPDASASSSPQMAAMRARFDDAPA